MALKICTFVEKSSRYKKQINRSTNPRKASCKFEMLAARATTKFKFEISMDSEVGLLNV
jgi:hypothetical protein